MREKRGQVTLFIVFGILLLAVGIFLYFQTDLLDDDLRSQREEINQLPQDILVIRNQISSCIYDEGERGLVLLGQGGGEIVVLQTPSGIEIPIKNFVEYKEEKIPTIEDMQDSLVGYLQMLIPACASGLNYTDKNITFENPYIDTIFSEKEVILDIKFPITISSKKGETKFSSFYFKYPVRMKHIHDISKKLVEESLKNNGMIDIYAFSDMDVDIELNPYKNNYYVYEIYDPHSWSVDENYYFTFGLVLPTGDMILDNEAPVLLVPNGLNATINETFIYDVEAVDINGEDITYFTDREDLFLIGEKSGLINFTPTLENKGIQIITIVATDERNLSTTKTVELDIK